MDTLTLSVYHEYGDLKTAAELLHDLRTGTQKGPTKVSFHPAGALPEETVHTVLTHLPKNCAGITLSTLTPCINTPGSIEQFERWCSWLPAHVTLLDLNALMHYSVSHALQCQIIQALPKTLNQIILRNNHLGYHRTAEELRELFAPLDGVHIFDLRDNHVHEVLWSEAIAPKPFLPSTCTTVSLDLSPYSLVCGRYLLSTLPPKTHTLCLSNACALQALVAHIPPTVTTLKLISVDKEPWILPSTMTTLDLSGCLLHSEFTFHGLPPHITTVLLANLAYAFRTAQQWLTLIHSIPATVTYVNLQGNSLFRGRTPSARDQLLRALQPVNPQGRLDLRHTGEDDWVRAALPLIHGVEQKIIPNLDCAYHIATFLGAHSQTVFQRVAHRKRLAPPLAPQNSEQSAPRP